MLAFQHHAVLSRQHSDELGGACLPLIDYSPRHFTLGVLEVTHDQRMQLFEFVGVVDRPQLDHPEIAARRKRTVFVEHIRDAAAHSGCEIASSFAEHRDQSARHIFASVIANALDHRVRAAVAHRKSLARNAAKERLAAGRAVKRDISDDDVLLGLEGRCSWRAHRHESAGQALAAVVVRVALEIERDAGGKPRSETLARGASEMNLYRVWRKA